MKDAKQKALVLLSGGQDSTTCLYWAIDRFGRNAVSTVSFDYGQRHFIELDCAEAVAAQAAVPHLCLPIDTLAALGGDALTDPDIGVESGIDESSGLPNTFVPGRNLIFLTYAAAHAYRNRIGIWSPAWRKLTTAAIPTAGRKPSRHCSRRSNSVWRAMCRSIRR